MDTTNILKWALFAMFLILHSQMEGPIAITVPIPPFAPHPLCSFQLALANQACAYLPISHAPPPSPRSPPAPVAPIPSPPSQHHRRRHSHRDKHGHLHEHGHGHGHNHDQVLVHGHGHLRHHHGHHRHGHGHGHHRHKILHVEQQCCRWLAQVDNECVCELLVCLPPFLSRPTHEYTVRVDGSCNATYSCGRLLRL